MQSYLLAFLLALAVPPGAALSGFPLRSASSSPEAGEPVTSTPRLTLDLARVLALARQHGREARLAQEELGLAYQRLGFVRSSYHPTGQAQATDPENRSLRLDQKLGQGTRATVSLNQVGQGGVSRVWSVDHQLFVNNAYDVRLANLAFAVARETFRLRIEDFKLDVIRRFFDLLRAQLRYRTLQEAVGRAGDLVASARARFDLGTTSKLDVLNTEVELANAQNDLLAQRQTVDRSRDELLDLIGLALDTPLDVTDTLALARPDEPTGAWYRSELAVERGRVELARTQMNQARYESRPELRVNAQVDEDAGSRQREVQTTLRYNFPIGTAPTDHAYRQLKHAHDSAELTWKNRQYQIAREQRDIRRTLHTKEESVRIAKFALANATEAYEASQISFARGLISNIDLRTTQANLTRARDSYLSLVIDTRVAVYQYRRLFGGEL